MDGAIGEKDSITLRFDIPDIQMYFFGQKRRFTARFYFQPRLSQMEEALSNFVSAFRALLLFSSPALSEEHGSASTSNRIIEALSPASNQISSIMFQLNCR